VFGVYRWYDSLSIYGGLGYVNVSLYCMDYMGPEFLEPWTLLTVSK